MSRNNGKTKKEQSHKVFLSKEFVSDLTRQNMLYAKIVRSPQKNIRISAQKISIHIAKGFERVTNSDFLRHLYFAQEYSSEIKTLIYIAIDLNIISEEEKDNIFEKLEEVNKLIGGFVKHIKTKIANREKE